MPATNPYAVTALKRLGVEPEMLGCVMLDVEMPQEYRSVMDQEWAYYSSILPYVRGFENEAHITLLYGLVLGASAHQDLVDGVMEGWVKPNSVLFDEVSVFEGNDGIVDYGAIVLKPNMRTSGDREIASLEDANQRLGQLPHIRPFPDYNPHITVGYVHKQFINAALTELRMMEPKRMGVKELNYGKV